MLNPRLGDVIYETERSRVRRVPLPDGAGAVVCKEPLGAARDDRVRNEIEMLRRLSDVDGVPALFGETYPGIVAMVDAGGVPLSAKVAAGPLETTALLSLAHALAGVIAAVHQRGVIHKDISPANVLLLGAQERPVLLDFEWATTAAGDRLSFVHHDRIAGTLAYLAPEQTGRTGLAVDHRADLYALGAVLYHAAAGRPPFVQDDHLAYLHDLLVCRPTPLVERNPAVPLAFSQIIDRLLEKDPDRRYQSAEGLVRDLGRVLAAPDAVFPLGEWDFPLRLSAPTRLVGRDAEVGVLRTAFDGAQTGDVRTVVIAGAPGVGKSALVNELRTVVATHGGWYVAGKCEQFRSDAGSGGLVQALSGIGRLLLAEPQQVLSETRERLLHQLGPNTALVAAALPEFEPLLGGGAATPEEDPVTAATRLRQALLGLLRAVVSPERPVVLVVDDLQWADSTTLAVLDTLATDSGLRGLLLVGAYRTQEVPPTHPLAAALERWERLGAMPPVVQLENLPPSDQSRLLADMLRLPDAGAAELAAAIAGWTGGNPYDTVELVNSLRRSGALRLGEGGWRWDPDALAGQLGRGDVVDLLTARLTELPAEARELVRTLACLGGETRLGSLAVASGLPFAAVRERLAAPLEDGLLVVESDGSLQDEPEQHTLRFPHDRVYQAAYTTIPPQDRTGLHLRIARRLAAEPGYETEAAEHYVDGLEAVEDAEELRRVAVLLERAGQAARRVSSHQLARRYLDTAVQVWAQLGVPADDPVLTELDRQRHAVLYSLSLLDEADAAFESLQRRCADPVTLAVAGTVQMSSLSQRAHHRAAVDLGLRLARDLGYPRPETPPGPDDFVGLLAWVAELDLAADLERPEVTDRAVLAVQRLFDRLLPNAFFVGDPALLVWIVLESQRMWQEFGPAPRLASNFGCVGLAVVPALGDYWVGYEAARHAMAVGETRGWEPETSVLRHRYALLLLPWMEPLQNAVVQCQMAREGLLQGGDLQMACHTYETLLPARLETGESLSTYAADVEAAHTFATRTGSHHSLALVDTFRRLERSLRSDSTAFDDRPDGDGIAGAHFHAYRALKAVLFDEQAALLHHSRQAMTLRRFLAGYPGMLAQLFRALALAAQLRGDPGADAAQVRAELDECRDWLAGRAADQPENFGHLLLLVDAERAWSDGAAQTALARYDAAAREAQARQRPWHRALIAERTAHFCFAQDLSQAARRALLEARREYDAWGAGAKVAALDAAYPFLRTVDRLRAGDAARQSTHSTVVSGEALDMLAILRASQALSSETNLRRLRAAIVDQLTALTGATDIVVVVKEDGTGRWLVPGAGRDDAPMPVEEAAQAGQLPATAFRYAERTRQPLLVEDAVRDNRFARDAYVAALDRCSLLVVPVQHQGAIRAMLVLSNRLSSGAFTADRLDTIMLIVGQLAVSLRNALLYDSLEARVADRTRELAAANRQLETLSNTDALTGLANRRRFTRALAAAWDDAGRRGTSLGLVMIDVDHFKLFNDRYGHPEGDQCLRMVAAALGGCVRGSDLLCRYGGEEFVVILPTVDEMTAWRIGERFRDAVSAVRHPHEAAPAGHVTVSVGVSTIVPSLAATPGDLVARADAALYEAKQRGRNQACFLPRA
ncbi:diguanylate cyclase [Actinoplanes sp. NPDC049548]|uniref:diguanylate cyclase domain-containing protein n=1 Tax=Actinoplanes sp. NPDC049548 TaxID=3155152 RepID=UPI00342F14CA